MTEDQIIEENSEKIKNILYQALEDGNISHDEFEPFKDGTWDLNEFCGEIFANIQIDGLNITYDNVVSIFYKVY